jgi:hypothetical protein
MFSRDEHVAGVRVRLRHSLDLHVSVCDIVRNVDNADDDDANRTTAVNVGEGMENADRQE